MNGEQLRDEGVARVLQGKDEWLARFDAAADRLLASNGHVTSDMVIESAGLPPGSSNAVGAAMLSWARNRKARKLGYVTSKRDSRHYSIVAKWGLL